MEAEFSKKMCRRLADYEYYLKTECKSPLLQKDKIVVDRDQLLDLVADLLAFHSADQHLEESVELDVSTVQMTKEQILKNAAWQARQMVSEAEVVRASTLENALEEAKKEAERITGEAKSYDAKVKAEAEEIVNMTLSERREELEKARRELEESREGVLNEARKEGEIILEEVRKEAEELRQRLDEEIENYRKAREAELKESLKEAQKIAQETLEEKTRDALQLYADTVHKTEEMVNLIVAIYDQQLEVIQQDRKDISAIVEKLERQNLPHGLQRSRR
jgi:vacuolar-type H+-ATPase subunit H